LAGWVENAVCGAKLFSRSSDGWVRKKKMEKLSGARMVKKKLLSFKGGAVLMGIDTNKCPAWDADCLGLTIKLTLTCWS